MIAPERAKRPGAAVGADVDLPTEEELLSCPFCEGREDRTPPETFALGPEGRVPDTPGWTVRVVPNLYPIFEHHEVAISTPRHARSFAELNEDEVFGVATAWSARARSARAAGFPYVHALLNEGREAGASLAHAHTQLVWLREPPPAVRVEAAEQGDDCPVCEQLENERRAGSRVVAECGGLVLLAAYGGRLPYELVVAPLAHPSESAFESDLLPGALSLLAEGIRRLRAVEGAVPLNAWLHDRPHWHLELLPRLTVFAGIELGAGIYVNSVAPEAAAETLRSAG
ncbi:MAG: DUF4921 family protein [Actinomycetota bacterium]|nr:DUF4921 family protein [Actinomycetota bacterium]